MADKYYGMNQGEALPVQVTEGAATTGKAIELRINDTMYASKLDAILAVRGILHYLETRETWPIA